MASLMCRMVRHMEQATQVHHSWFGAAGIGSIVGLIKLCEGAYSENTLRGYAADLRSFQSWCDRQRRNWLPADPQTIADYVDQEIDTLAASTVKRRLCAIKFAHRLADLPDPTRASVVHLAVRRAARRKSRRPVQAAGLTLEILKRILDATPNNLTGQRDAALISIGYDTLCRSCELAALRVEHLGLTLNREWSVLIPRSKGDQAGDGRIAWLSPRTIDLIERWMEASGVQGGVLFRSLHLGRLAATPLDTSSIRRLVRRAARRAGIDLGPGQGLSGHSMRVGAAQDMLVAGFDALAIMQAGGWKSPNVLLRYVENAATQSLHQRRWATITDAARLS